MATLRELTPDELSKIDKNNFEFRISIELGPALIDNAGSATWQEVKSKLNAAGQHRSNSALGQLLLHIVEHIDVHSKKDSVFISTPAPIHIETVYYGCGSCTPANPSFPQGSTCIPTWGTATCDPC